eukprot:TRINITY_DN10631_c0_g1_i1.p1 TRINITY_DN10631_c0_g1~~TRINITY_DN10631_c0_g1_i1.p1  ORF type:complete len:119 (-),score=27.33 TRINITY_DN10631_c0_g1_i1:67-423(-)
MTIPIILVMPKYVDESRPTRVMVEDVIRSLRRDGKGNLYFGGLLVEVVALIWDFIQKKSTGIPDMMALGQNIMTEDRLKLERRWVKENGKMMEPDICCLDGLTKEEIDELTEPIGFYV